MANTASFPEVSQSGAFCLGVREIGEFELITRSKLRDPFTHQVVTRAVYLDLLRDCAVGLNDTMGTPVSLSLADRCLYCCQRRLDLRLLPTQPPLVRRTQFLYPTILPPQCLPFYHSSFRHSKNEDALALADWRD